MATAVGDAETIFTIALQAVQPRQLVAQNVRLRERILRVFDSSFPLNHNVHIVGFGKASLGLVNHIGEVLKDHVVDGVISCPDLPTPEDEALKDLACISPSLASRIAVFKGPTDNIPNATVLDASLAVYELCKELDEEDILLTVVTGGGSALLTLPAPGIELSDVATTTRLLSHAGCDIAELNTVRKQLDLLKGGGLARLAQPAQVISLILSDVIGDPLDIIAGGPTVENSTGPEAALAIFEKYNLMKKVPDSVLAFLKHCDGSRNSSAGSAVNFILGSNRVALSAAASKASELGYRPLVLSRSLCGSAESLGHLLSSLACCYVTENDEQRLSQLLEQLQVEDVVKSTAIEVFRKQPDKLCVLAGCEATVTVVPSPGLGGRAAHMALCVARDLAPLAPCPMDVAFLVGATDGMDGPTPLGGAWVTPQTLAEAKELGLDVADHLNACDAYGFFRKIQNGVNIREGGLTGTNVMDIVVVTFQR